MREVFYHSSCTWWLFCTRVAPSRHFSHILANVYIEVKFRHIRWHLLIIFAIAMTSEIALRISSPKNSNLLKMYSSSGHPSCRWVCFFIRTDSAIYHLQPVDPLWWMGAVGMGSGSWWKHLGNPHHSCSSIKSCKAAWL